MAVGKEIRTKISSIQSTQKITSAMEMVAASKMRKAQDRMEVGKPYARRMRDVVGHLANSAPEYRHVYMEERDPKRVGFIVVAVSTVWHIFVVRVSEVIVIINPLRAALTGQRRSRGARRTL